VHVEDRRVPAMTDDVAGLSDGELVRQIAAAPARSGAAEQELCRRFVAPIRLYGRRHLRDEQAAADLVQEVTLVVLQAVRAGRVADPDRIAHFVSGTCRFVARRWLERQERDDRQAGHADVAGGDAWQPPWGSLDRDRLTSCLGRLLAKARQVIYMTFQEDRAADDIGAAIGLSAGNVRVIRHRTLAQLRTCLGGGA
jgi:RNA polymerase sigma-70 factor, ECF subfamily